MSDYKVFVTQMTVLPKGESLFSEKATTVQVTDDAAGCFVTIKQEGGSVDTPEHQISLEPQEWPVVREAIDKMIAECALIDKNVAMHSPAKD
jgi:hypothetical protein